ncbi:hypothetical protein RUM43_007880 [Polyplax serrata]|uniref:Uncharacterized protein n=1 Tax=Polyplax serrata TaxID=468196 RepID=A0AAN8PY58_POLSC
MSVLELRSTVKTGEIHFVSLDFRVWFVAFTCLVTVEITTATSVEIVTPVGFTTTEKEVTTTTEAPKTTTTSKPKHVKSPPPKSNSFDWPSNDSYIQAYMGLHRRRPSKRNDGYGPPDASYNTVIRSSVMPDSRYPSLTLTNQEEWAQSRPQSYLPPSYSFPTYRPYEGSPSMSQWQGKPYSSPPTSDLFGLIPKKLSLKLIFKIILKLVLFKMIVKFIAVICLLLFLPALKSKESHRGNSAGDDEFRKTQHLNDVTGFIWNSIQDWTYGQQQDDDEEEEDELETIKKIADLADMEPPTPP